MRYKVHSTLLCAMLTGAMSLQGQQPVPLRDLTTIEAKSAEPFGNIFGVRPISGGGVLVNDGIRRQLVALDASLGKRTIVVDSAADGGTSYGPRAAPLIPYLADSSLFVDGASLTLLVFNPAGKVSHVMAAPKPSDLRFLASAASGTDAKGNLIYEGIVAIRGRGQLRDPSQMMASLQSPDTAPVVRANFDTRTVDTLAWVKTQTGGTMSLSRGANGTMMAKRTINPLQTIDEWAVLADGSIAIIRGHDYHIDWIKPDGSRFSSAKLPFDWKRLTDDDKQKLIDSARTAVQNEAAAARAGGGGRSASPAGGTPGGDGGATRISFGTTTGAGGGGGGASINAGAGAPQQMSVSMPTPTIDFVSLKEIADYYPPIRAGAAQPDLDGNLWILPTTSAQSRAGELVYDVVNNKGELTQRVRIPAGRSIAGFGHGGVVYLMSRDARGSWFLERARLGAA